VRPPPLACVRRGALTAMRVAVRGAPTMLEDLTACARVGHEVSAVKRGKALLQKTAAFNVRCRARAQPLTRDGRRP